MAIFNSYFDITRGSWKLHGEPPQDGPDEERARLCLGSKTSRKSASPGLQPREHALLGKIHLPSGNLLHNYGKSPFLMGKSTISMAIFNSYVKLPEGR